MKVIASMLFALAAVAAGGATITAGKVEVVVAKDVCSVVRYAAGELTNGLSRTLGAAVPVVRAPSGPGTVSIVLGACNLSRAAGIDVTGFAPDEFVVRVASNVIFIAGRDDPKLSLPNIQKGGAGYGTLLNHDRATLHGVFYFLERYAGMRFYLPDDELGVIVKPAASVDVPEGETRVVPDFLIREPYMGGDGAWYNERAKGDRGRIKVKAWTRLRLSSASIPCCHGSQFFRFIERFGKDHPEYMAKKRNGERWLDPKVFAPYQLCWSNPGFQEELYQDVKAYLTGKPPSSRGLKTWWPACRGKYVDIMPDDSFQGCHCERCQAAYVRLPGDRHYATELIWGVTAKIAQRLIDEGIEGNVTQMAYPPYRRVPDFKLPPNVQVMVAESGPWSMVNPQKLAREESEIRAWTEKLGHKVWIWTYPHKWGRTAIAGVPCMAPHAWGEYFKRMSPLIFGSFAESESDKAIYNHLNYYVFSRVAWDVKTDVDAVIGEYHRLMFGAAAEEMAKFNLILERKWLKEVVGRIEETSVGPIAKPPSSYQLWTAVYSRETRATLVGLVKAATAKVAPGSLEARRIDLMKREFLDPLVEEAEKFERETSVAAGLALRAREPNRSIVPPIGRGWNSNYELDTSTFVTPPHSIRFSGTNTAAVGFYFGTQGLPALKPNTRYRLTYFVKTQDVEPRMMYGGGGGIAINIWDDHNRWFPSKNMFTGTMDWIFQKFEFTTGPDVAKHRPYIRMHRLHATGTAWFDDLRLEEIDEKGNLK